MSCLTCPAAELLAVVASDRCGRKLSRLCAPEMFVEAAALLDVSVRPVILTGFYVPGAEAPETDGPPGAVVLARVLKRLGKDAVVITDKLNFTVVAACCRVMGIGDPEGVEDASGVMSWDPDLLVFIERLGSACDGKYHNMRGEDISAWTPPLDLAADNAIAKGIPVLAIGDGGNEAGMASLMPGMGSLLPDFRNCLSTVGSTVAVPVDVSNWGGYALACMLSVAHGKWLGHSPEEERAMVAAMAEAGAVDGVTGLRELSVDGLEISEHMEVVGKIKGVFNKGVNGQR